MDWYYKLEEDLLRAYLEGDKQTITEIAEFTDIRRVPLAPGYNHQVKFPELNNHPFTYWPITIHMLWA